MSPSAPLPDRPPYLIKGEALTKIIGSTTLLNNVDITISPGEIVSVIGPNGAGKTTLVRLVLKLSEPTSGALLCKSGSTIGYVPQSFALDPTIPLTPERFVRIGTRATAEAAKSQLEDLNLGNLQHRLMTDLSGGETQRVLLARALLRKPQLLVLDEPAAGLDVTGEADLYQLIQDIRDELGCGILLVSHDLHMVMAATDHVICLNGHICCSGAPSHVTRHPEFTNLFGAQAASVLAPYLHVHNHQHTAHGDIEGAGETHPDD